MCIGSLERCSTNMQHADQQTSTTISMANARLAGALANTTYTCMRSKLTNASTHHAQDAAGDELRATSFHTLHELAEHAAQKTDATRLRTHRQRRRAHSAHALSCCSCHFPLVSSSPVPLCKAVAPCTGAHIARRRICQTVKLTDAPSCSRVPRTKLQTLPRHHHLHACASLLVCCSQGNDASPGPATHFASAFQNPDSQNPDSRLHMHAATQL
jgi:hypothetical protein